MDVAALDSNGLRDDIHAGLYKDLATIGGQGVDGCLDVGEIRHTTVRRTQNWSHYKRCGVPVVHASHDRSPEDRSRNDPVSRRKSFESNHLKRGLFSMSKVLTTRVIRAAGA